MSFFLLDKEYHGHDIQNCKYKGGGRITGATY